MKMKHTPGPWRAYQGEETKRGRTRYYWAVAPAVGGRIAELDDPFPASDEANAHLIAAAPDLLVACEAALDWFVSVAADGAPATTVAAAIKKARGE